MMSRNMPVKCPRYQSKGRETKQDKENDLMKGIQEIVKRRLELSNEKDDDTDAPLGNCELRHFSEEIKFELKHEINIFLNTRFWRGVQSNPLNTLSYHHHPQLDLIHLLCILPRHQCIHLQILTALYPI